MRNAALDHITLNFVDVDRALVFYHEVLGFETVRLEEYRAGKTGFPSIRLNADRVINIPPADRVVHKKAQPYHHLCLNVGGDELDTLRAWLLQNEVEILDEV